MSELLALGISHKTAPLELRERVALTEGRAAGVLRELVEAPEVHEAAAISTCNRTELYMVAPDRSRPSRWRWGARPRGGDPPDGAGRPPLLAAGGRRRRPPVPGDRGAGLDDHRRGRGPGPGEARLRAGAGRGRDGADPQPAVPRRARRRQAGAVGDRRSPRRAVGALGRGRAGAAHAWRSLQPSGARGRRRRDGGAHRPSARATGPANTRCTSRRRTAPPREIKIPTKGHFYTAAWSPDGKRIMLSRHEPEAVGRGRRDGQAKVVGSDPWMVPTRTMNPAWSPGRQVDRLREAFEFSLQGDRSR